jgi:hypothetical protein
VGRGLGRVHERRRQHGDGLQQGGEGASPSMGSAHAGHHPRLLFPSTVLGSSVLIELLFTSQSSSSSPILSSSQRSSSLLLPPCSTRWHESPSHVCEGGERIRTDAGWWSMCGLCTLRYESCWSKYSSHGVRTLQIQDDIGEVLETA